MFNLKIGDDAPEFELPVNENETLKLSNLKGTAVVLYFYPKDDTTGCTAEAIDFNRLKKEFDKINVKILGMSPDDSKKHNKFKTKHDLDLTLISDENKETLESYGVWVEKSMYGKKYMGVERSTFLIDKNGKIAQLWRKVSVPGHAEAVLAAAQKLTQ